MTMRWMSLMALMLSGCAARGTYHLVQAQAAVDLARQDEADEFAVYAWTMADAYLKKAREEYFHADYEAAELYSAKAEEWANRARDIVRMSDDPMNSAPDALPELRDAPTPGANPIFDNSEDDVQFDLEDDE